MSPDIIMVVGLIVGAFAIPSLISAWADKRPAWLAFLFLISAAALVFYAYTSKEGGYTWAEVPAAFINVIALIIN